MDLRPVQIRVGTHGWSSGRWNAGRRRGRSGAKAWWIRVFLEGGKGVWAVEKITAKRCGGVVNSELTKRNRTHPTPGKQTRPTVSMANEVWEYVLKQLFAGGESKECPVCLKELSSWKDTHFRVCGHLFHLLCAFRHHGNDERCPVCREHSGVLDTAGGEARYDDGYDSDSWYETKDGVESSAEMTMEELYKDLLKTVVTREPISRSGVASVFRVKRDTEPSWSSSTFLHDFYWYWGSLCDGVPALVASTETMGGFRGRQ